MDIAEAVAFLREHHHAVLATMRRDGTPQMSLVDAGVDEAGRVVISSRETAMKVANLRRDPRGWLCVFTDGFYGSWVQVGGPVEVISMPEALPLLVDYYRRLSGEHPDWDDYRAAMHRDRRVLIRLTPATAGPSVSG